MERYGKHRRNQLPATAALLPRKRLKEILEQDRKRLTYGNPGINAAIEVKPYETTE